MPTNLLEKSTVPTTMLLAELFPDTVYLCRNFTLDTHEIVEIRWVDLDIQRSIRIGQHKNKSLYIYPVILHRIVGN